ncbi:hypothetical protein GGR56DRAFT_156646 [Xylariaceae sp. FL0804]|nr:hypothetical protein GGR56DRAFT_156646 [Xylariaceae sp. FL0804]
MSTSSYLGALTTSFQFPADCISQPINTYIVINAAPDSAAGPETSYHLTAGPGPPSCFSPRPFPSVYQYFSPGLCPSDYTWACSQRNILSFSLTETTVICCPSFPYSYSCNTDTSREQWGVFTNAGCTTVLGTWTISESGTSAIARSALQQASIDQYGNAILFNVVINAHGVQVRWQPSDEAVLSHNNPTITTSSSTSNQTPSQTSPIQSTAPLNETSRSKGLSSGTIAGAVVGAVYGSAILIGLIVWVALTKRRRQRRDKGSTSFHPAPGHILPGQLNVPSCSDANISPGSAYERRELPTPDRAGVIQRAELPAGFVHEVG